MRLTALRANNLRAIRQAGPRYAPGLDPTSPNLAITSLTAAFEVIGLAASFRSNVRGLRTEFETAWLKASRAIIRGFLGHAHNPTLLGARLAELESASPREAVEVWRGIEITAKRSNAVVQRILERAANLFQLAPANSPERSRRETEYNDIREFASALGNILLFVENSSALIKKNTVLLLGGWGMGKTHSLCDLTERRVRSRQPTLFYLAQELPDRVNPIDGLCQVSGLARDARRLLSTLDRLGLNRNERALLIIDAINEGDRVAWRRALPALVREFRRYPNIALILSCRQPFEELIISKRTARKFVVVQHRGFGEIEFEAQLSFFQHYDIPAPQVPLITPEYSRPLFLHLLCKAITNLSPTGKHRQIHNFASGQRGMTYLLEYVANKLGATIERDLGLPLKTCWRILKGSSVAKGGPPVGVAPLMAEQWRDYITWEEFTAAIEPFLPGPRRHQVAERVARRMVTDGLLTEEVRWQENGYREVVRFPYQRFGDHIIARHLLRHLNTISLSTIRRSFYRDRPLGRVFDLTASRQRFQYPGLASAIMLEFPARVERVVGSGDTELIS